jgi:dihydrofolate reductase
MPAAMARLIYSMGVSLDGFIADAAGAIDWSAPDEELHRLANEQAREASAFLFGRRLYELMEPHWPAAAKDPDVPAVEAEFARLYVETPRIVFSNTLEEVSAGARLVRSRDAVAEVTRLKQQPGGHLDAGGAGLAATLLDLIDEFRLFVHPVLVGGGTRFFPDLRERVQLRLAESRTFPSGVLYLRYERAGSAGEAPPDG